MKYTIYAYPSKQNPTLPKQKFKGLTEAEKEARYAQLLAEGYTNIDVQRLKMTSRRKVAVGAEGTW